MRHIPPSPGLRVKFILDWNLRKPCLSIDYYPQHCSNNAGLITALEQQRFLTLYSRVLQNILRGWWLIFNEILKPEITRNRKTGRDDVHTFRFIFSVFLLDFLELLAPCPTCRRHPAYHLHDEHLCMCTSPHKRCAPPAMHWTKTRISQHPPKKKKKGTTAGLARKVTAGVGAKGKRLPIQQLIK